MGLMNCLLISDMCLMDLEHGQMYRYSEGYFSER